MPFNVGDKVRIVKEPRFVTTYNNSVWEIYPDPDEGKPCRGIWNLDCVNGKIKPHMGVANMKHLIGEEATVTGYIPNMFGKNHEEDKARGLGFYEIEFKNDVKVPKGLMSEGFDQIDLELVP